MRDGGEIDPVRAELLHELRTPLTTVVGYAEIIALRGDERSRPLAEHILLAADRLSALLAGLAETVAEASTRNGGRSDRPAVLPPASCRASASTRRVAIVDDDAAIRTLVRSTLPADGFQILEASDGTEALALLCASPPDLVVLDWNMPGRAGGEVLRELRAVSQDVKVIVLTADPTPPRRAEAEALDAVFLAKPFSPMELIGAAERLLA